MRSLQRTVSLPLKIGLLPQKETNHLNQSSIFRNYVSFRESILQGTGPYPSKRESRHIIDTKSAKRERGSVIVPGRVDEMNQKHENNC